MNDWIKDNKRKSFQEHLANTSADLATNYALSRWKHPIQQIFAGLQKYPQTYPAPALHC